MTLCDQKDNRTIFLLYSKIFILFYSFSHLLWLKSQMRFFFQSIISELACCSQQTILFFIHLSKLYILVCVQKSKYHFFSQSCAITTCTWLTDQNWWADSEWNCQSLLNVLSSFEPSHAKWAIQLSKSIRQTCIFHKYLWHEMFAMANELPGDSKEQGITWTSFCSKFSCT